MKLDANRFKADAAAQRRDSRAHWGRGRTAHEAEL